VGGDNFQRQFNLVDGVTWIKGAHTLKFGADYRRLSPILSSNNFTNYNFGAVSNAIAGRLNNAQLFRTSNSSLALYTNLSAYSQDSWKITHRLTLTYGVRWEVNPPPSSPNGHLPVTVSNINAPEPISLAPRNTALWKTTYNNFAPRIGIAYQLSQRAGRELVIRGGFGAFYDTGFGVSANGFQLYPFTASKNLTNVTYPLSATDAQPPVPGTGAPQFLFIMDPHLKLPYTYQWNIAVEQSLGSAQALTVSYIGSSGHRLLRSEAYSPLFTEFGSTRVPITFITNSSISDYHSLQVQFQRRLVRGLQAQVNYTLAKSNDTVSDDFGGLSSQAPNTVIDLKQEYGPSDFDVRHIFTSGITYDLPKATGPRLLRALLNGWGVDSLVRLRTAFPFNVLANVTFPTRVQSVRPNIVPGVPQILTGPQYPGGKRINNAAFSAPLAGTVGNFPRNSLRGFSAQQVDMTLRRQFAVKESVKLQLRFEVFNIFNHPNFADPSQFLSGSTFGVSQSMLNRGLGGLSQLYQIGGPRSAQIAAKILF